MKTGLSIKKNVPLASLTTFKIGGLAKYFVEIKNKGELRQAIEWVKKKNEKYFILAGGSNFLINDNGVSGLVIKLKNNTIKIYGNRIECGAGANLMQVVSMSAGSGLTGMEWAAGIPGTVGGAVRGNAGAYGLSSQDIVETVEVFNILKDNFFQYSRRDCCFKYRHSIFKDKKNLLIWNIVLRLSKRNLLEVNDLIGKHLSSRRCSSPRLPSAGCVFMNLSIDDLRKANFNLAKIAEKDGAIKKGKIGAGWLIDKLGLKGKAIGGAKVSLEHANFIVNTGKATAEEVIMLISYIKQQARNRFKIQLKEEIQYLGF